LKEEENHENIEKIDGVCEEESWASELNGTVVVRRSNKIKATRKHMKDFFIG